MSDQDNTNFSGREQPELLEIGDLILGMNEDGTFEEGSEVRFPIDPHGQAKKDGQATAVFRGPGPSTVTAYNNQRFGLKGNRANEWKAAEDVLGKRFKDFEGIRMSDALRTKYGTWKSFLLTCSGARDFARNLAAAYVDEVKTRAGARTADVEE